jgi:hypothetical protein
MNLKLNEVILPLDKNENLCYTILPAIKAGFYSLIQGGDKYLPSGNVHYKFYKFGFLTSIPSSLYMLVNISPSIAFGNIMGYWFHRYCDNDWDIVGINHSEGRAIRELKVIGWLIYGVSSMYGAIFMDNHRSFLTHFPLVSTLLRLIFLFWWIPVLWFFNKITIEFWEVQFAVGFLLGLSQADTYHYFADMIWQEVEDKLVLRIFNKKKRNSRNKIKPKYKEFLIMAVRVLFGYFYNNLYTKIFRKR